MRELIEFDEAKKVSNAIIMVIGVGGGGSNAVNHMFDLEEKRKIKLQEARSEGNGNGDEDEVAYMICNTDRQALQRSRVPLKICLGKDGLGAGNNPEKGREAAEMSIEDIKNHLTAYKIEMVFITAGMGGGTGTGAAPVIAAAAKELKILTVGIVTMPLRAEGRKRIEQAERGLEEMKKYVDSLLIINNENIRKLYGDLAYTEAFGKADDILATAASSISGIVSKYAYVNADMEDVKAVMRDSGVSLMCMADCNSKDSLTDAMSEALKSPLLNHNDIRGARKILVHVRCGREVISLNKLCDIMENLQEMTGGTNVIWGAGQDEELGDKNSVTIIATDFDANIDVKNENSKGDKPKSETVKSEEPAKIEPAILTTNNDKPVIIEIDYEDWETRPAYIRRKMVFENTRGETPKPDKEHSPAPGSVSMFN